MTDSQKIAVVYDSVLKIEHELHGNGQPGIVQRITSLERWRAYLSGMLFVAGILAGLGGEKIVMAILK